VNPKLVASVFGFGCFWDIGSGPSSPRLFLASLSLKICIGG